MTRVTVRDCLDVGFCAPGQRRFFAQHGLDFRRFVREGMDVAEVAHIDDVKIRQAEARAAQREAGEGVQHGRRKG